MKQTKHHSINTLFERGLITAHGTEDKGHFPLVSIWHLQIPDNLTLLKSHNLSNNYLTIGVFAAPLCYQPQTPTPKKKPNSSTSSHFDSRHPVHKFLNIFLSKV